MRQFLASAVEALRESHFDGVLHNDIKPGNILRDKQGRASKLILACRNSGKIPRTSWLRNRKASPGGRASTGPSRVIGLNDIFA